MIIRTKTSHLLYMYIYCIMYSTCSVQYNSVYYNTVQYIVLGLVAVLQNKAFVQCTMITILFLFGVLLFFFAIHLKNVYSSLSPGLETHTVYPQGLSCTLPIEHQQRLLKCIKGLENSSMVQCG